jgi:hypothetical protein
MTTITPPPGVESVTPLWPSIEEYVQRAIAKALRGLRLKVGTVVLSPSQGPDDPLMVIFDGSSSAVPVKMIRAFNVFPEARVVCAKVGRDTVALGVFIDTDEANIVAGIPDAARFEFDPYLVNGKVFDSDGQLVIEMDQTTGVSVYDPQGVPGNRVRMVTESGQMVLSQSMGDAADFWVTRLVTSTGLPGFPNEYVFTQIEGIEYKPKTGFNRILLRSQRLDDSAGPFILIDNIGDGVVGEIQLRTEGDITFLGHGSEASANFTNFKQVFLAGDRLTASENGINNATGSGTNATTSYANLPGTSSFQFIKRFADTRVRVDIQTSFFSTAVTTSARFAALINGTDYDVAQQFVNPANTHIPVAGHRYITGIPAGTYTVQGRWRRVAGAGTLTQAAADNWLSLSAKEVSD